MGMSGASCARPRPELRTAINVLVTLAAAPTALSRLAANRFSLSMVDAASRRNKARFKVSAWYYQTWVINVTFRIRHKS
jgi:hypothetical protein